MERRELRLGNYIKDNISGTEPLGILTGEAIDKAMQLSPIILTEEWLIRFGFIKTNQGWFKNYIAMQNTQYEIPEGYEDKNYWVVAQYDQVDGQGHLLNGIELKYVHQLQNLYFALTGEELEIKK